MIYPYLSPLKDCLQVHALADGQTDRQTERQTEGPTVQNLNSKADNHPLLRGLIVSRKCVR